MGNRCSVTEVLACSIWWSAHRILEEPHVPVLTGQPTECKPTPPDDLVRLGLVTVRTAVCECKPDEVERQTAEAGIEQDQEHDVLGVLGLHSSDGKLQGKTRLSWCVWVELNTGWSQRCALQAAGDGVGISRRLQPSRRIDKKAKQTDSAHSKPNRISIRKL